MSKKEPKKSKDTIQRHGLTGEDLPFFIESKQFTSSWNEMGLYAEADLTELQLTIMSNPKRAPVISGTGGLRKLRFAPPGWEMGKSGAVRVCYAYFEEYGIVFLIVVYRKSEKDNLTATERAAIKTYINRAKVALDRLKRVD
jgi:hypothetical protein